MAGKDRTFCTVDGCGSPVLAKALCGKHYERLRRTGTTDERVRERVTCVRCEKRDGDYVRPDGRVCKACYQKEKRAARPEPTPGVCANASCGKTFTPRRNSDQTRQQKFCSRQCKEEANRRSGRAAEAALKSYYWRRYGLTLEEVEALRAKGCGICGIELTAGGGRWGNLHIDHNHVTGVVRGALCSECNLGLGKFGENPDLLEKAAAYLRRE